jgi:hypothetical protein
MRMERLQTDIGEWARATFPGHDERGIISHLLSEAASLYMAIGGTAIEASLIAYQARRGTTIENESADVGILLATLADHCGFSLSDEIVMKMAINHKREWNADTNQFGFQEHIRGDEDERGHSALTTG